jgi:hypothetical protein
LVIIRLAVKLCYEWKQGDMARSLNRDRQTSLMLGASPCLAARADLAPVAHVALEEPNVFVIYRLDILSAEPAYLLTGVPAVAAPISVIAHALILLLIFLG